MEASIVNGLLRRRPQVFAWLLLVLVIAGLFSYWPFCVKATGEASASVEEADVAVRQAFNATLDAERAGANVSGLIVRLNEAGTALSEAENALRSGDSSGAANNASLCIGIAESVKSDAGVLKASTLDEARTVFWRYFTFSIVGIAAFVIALVLVWLRFKRGYEEKVLGMKPEVAADEA
jgi:hypothetical protein